MITTPDELFQAIDDGTVVGIEPDWAQDLALAAVSELSFKPELARAALVRARAKLPPGAFQDVAELIELRVLVREATPNSLRSAVRRLEALVARLPHSERAVRARSLHILGVACLKLDLIDQAEEVLVQALPLVDRDVALIHLLDSIALVLAAQGAWSEAVDTYIRLVRLRRERGDLLGVAISGGQLARLQVQLGHPQEGAAIAKDALENLPADAPLFTRIRLQTIITDARLDIGDAAACEAAERDLARLLDEPGQVPEVLRGYALMSMSRARSQAGDLLAATELLRHASSLAMPPNVVLLHEAMIDPTVTRQPRWHAAWDALGKTTPVTESEIQVHLLLAKREDATPDQRRAHLERAYDRTVEANNRMWMRWVEAAMAAFDPALHADRRLERFTGRQRHDLERTALEEVTIIFADLVNFTGRSSQMAPEEVMSTVRNLFELGVPVLAQFRVRPISYMGDGLLAICQGEHHERRGLEFARSLVARAGRITQLRHHVKATWPLDLRAGVASGPVVLGTLGSMFKTEFAAIGMTTNLAARLQGEAKPGEVMCTERVARAAGIEHTAEHLELKNIDEPTPAVRLHVYEPIARSSSAR